MGKYGRQYSGSNNSPILLWIMGLCVAGALVWRMNASYKRAQKIHEFEKDELQYEQETGTRVVVKDSITGRLDTMLLIDYLERKYNDSIRAAHSK